MQSDKIIEELEVQAAESELVAALAVEPETKSYNSKLAKELREDIARLRQLRA